MATAAAVEFDPVAHEYRRDGRVIPSVSHIMRDCGLYNHWYAKERDRQRGSAVHHAGKLICQGKYDESATHPDIVGYARGVERFLERHKYAMVGGETPLASLRLGYAGTPDNWGYLEDIGCLLDMKSGKCPPMVGIQLCAYKRLLNEAYPDLDIRKLRALELSGDGSFRLVEFDSPEWETGWQSALNIYNLKARHGV